MQTRSIILDQVSFRADITLLSAAFGGFVNLSDASNRIPMGVYSDIPFEKF